MLQSTCTALRLQPHGRAGRLPCPALHRRRAVACRAQQQALDNQPSSSSDAEREEASRHFASSLATLGLGAALLSERLNGEGVVAQLELWNHGVEPLILLTIGALLVAGLKPTKAARTEHSAIYNIQDIAGRISFLGLAGTLGAELATGKGLLAMLHIDTGVELSEVEGVLTFLIMLILTGPAKKTTPRI